MPMMKNTQYDANEHSIDRMIEVQRQKISHYKMLNTIYKKKSYSLIREERQIDRERQVRIKNQLLDKERKWRQSQRQINYQNNLLRNKLLQIYVPRDKDIHSVLKTNQSLDNINQTQQVEILVSTPQQTNQSRSKVTLGVTHNPSNKKMQTGRSIVEENNKIYNKLSNIQSELMPKLNLRQHSKDAVYLREMLMKSSPKRNMRMKKVVEKTISDRPKIYFPSSKTHRQLTISHSSINPESPFVFY